MESRPCRDGYIRRVKEAVESRGEIPSVVRFYYWIEYPRSMINNPSDNATFMPRLIPFFEGKTTPKYIELQFGEETVEITEYEAVLAGKQITAR